VLAREDRHGAVGDAGGDDALPARNACRFASRRRRRTARTSSGTRLESGFTSLFTKRLIQRAAAAR
jgi:hypothetical protein